MSMILTNLQVNFQETPLFTPVNLTVLPGQIATIMGPSGCGKSTLLSAICGNLAPGFSLSGTIMLDEKTLNDIDMEKRKVGILFQDDLLFPHFDVSGNMAFGLAGDLSARQKKIKISSALETAGLAGFEHRDIATLSGGQKARVSLLRTLLAEPQAILLDEPFSKLDQELKSSIRDFVFKQVTKLNIPALLVTHDKNDAAEGPLLELHRGTGNA